MRNGMKVLVIIGLLTISLMAFAADVKQMGVGKTQTITFIAPVKVGNATLTAGEYKVQHVMEGDNHVMVFKSAKDNKEQARVNCKMVELPKKADQSLQTYDTNASGAKVLVALTFRGDNYKHQF